MASENSDAADHDRFAAGGGAVDQGANVFLGHAGLDKHGLMSPLDEQLDQLSIRLSPASDSVEALDALHLHPVARPK